MAHSGMRRCQTALINWLFSVLQYLNYEDLITGDTFTTKCLSVHNEAEIPSIEQRYWQKFKYVPGVFWKAYQLNFHVCIANVCLAKAPPL